MKTHEMTEKYFQSHTKSKEIHFIKTSHFTSAAKLCKLNQNYAYVQYYHITFITFLIYKNTMYMMNI